MRRRDEALHAVAGSRVDPIACLRPPYAATNERAIRVAGELGKAIVLWSIDPQDRRRPGADQIASHILANVYPGAIILMHDGGDERAQTVAALEIVLDGASPRARVKPPNPPTPRQQARWKAIRQAQLQGLSMRATARVLGIARNTVSAYIRAGGPPGRQGAASCTSSDQTREEIFAEPLRTL